MESVWSTSLALLISPRNDGIRQDKNTGS